MNVNRGLLDRIDKEGSEAEEEEVEMREIINVSSGNCGNSLGLNFWEAINDEHGVGSDGKFQGTSDLQLERIYVYYHEGVAE